MEKGEKKETFQAVDAEVGGLTDGRRDELPDDLEIDEVREISPSSCRRWLKLLVFLGNQRMDGLAPSAPIQAIAG